MNTRQSVTCKVRPHRGYFLPACLCFYTKHNCLNFGFAFWFKRWYFLQKNTCSSHAGNSFHCWLRRRYTSWERQKLVFCDALTAGIRRKGRRRVESNDCHAPVTARKRRQACFWEKWPLMFWEKRNGSTDSSGSKVWVKISWIFPPFFGCLKLSWFKLLGLAFLQPSTYFCWQTIMPQAVPIAPICLKSQVDTKND